MLDNPLKIGLVKLLGRDFAYSPPMSVLCATIDEVWHSKLDWELCMVGLFSPLKKKAYHAEPKSHAW